jgi:hypothetical protein
MKRTLPQRKLSTIACLCVLCGIGVPGFAQAGDPVEIQVIDRENRRGIPMVELTTVDDVVYLTDSAGRVAFDEPELSEALVFFKVTSPGYQVAKDGFGIEGVRLKIEAGKSHTIEMTRVNLAERLYRITGRDIYRDSVRLGHSVPLESPVLNGKVVGQDSVQPAVYQNKLYWFWGDTNQLQYSLGLYRTAGAVSELPSQGGLDPSDGINLEYFTNDDGFARAMVEVQNPKGVVWIHGVCVVPDESGKETIVAQYSRRKGLSDALEQGHVKWNENRQLFEVIQAIDLRESWRMLRDHPVRHKDVSTDYLMFGNPFPVTRVPATLAAIQNPETYESYTCREEVLGQYATEQQLSESKPARDAGGTLVWAWKKAPPVTQQDEQRWLKQGLITIEEARYLPRDADQEDRVVQMHSGTVQWNAYRKRWIMIAIEHAWDKSSPSFLGEVFYSEAESAQGPYRKAVRVATHPKQSFYNPCHHVFFDQNDGRTIYFEGTYCNTFTTSPATPRYNYNQLMYRLDLGQKRLTEIFAR